MTRPTVTCRCGNARRPWLALPCALVAAALATTPAHAASADSKPPAPANEAARDPAVIGAGPRGWSEELIVSAYRLRSTAAESGASVWVIDEALIEQRAQPGVIDLLASAPGVTVNQNGAFGGQATARIRGAASGQTLVLLDGVPVNDTTAPGGGFDFGPADVSELERIEILKGPQSTLWGSDAIGGVIQLITRAPAPGLRGRAGFGIGSFGTVRGEAAVEGGSDRASIRLALASEHTDGISRADTADGNTEDDSHEVVTTTLNGRLNLTRNARLDLAVRHFDAETEFDTFGFVTGTQDGDELSRNRQMTAQLALQVAAFDDRLTHTLRYAWTDLERQNVSNGVPGFRADGQRRFWQYQGNFRLDAHQQLAFGAEHETTEDGSDDARTTGGFLLYQLAPIDSLTLAAGARVDDTDRFGSETVGRLSAAWQPAAPVTLRASWGEGFKAPTIFQTGFFCCGATAPNRALRPETSAGWDVGIDLAFAGGRGAASLTWFDQHTEEQIDFDFATGSYVNIAEVDTSGAEIAIDFLLTETLSFAGNATWLDSEDGNGASLVRTPEWTADTSLTWRPRADLNATLIVIHNGSETDSFGDVEAWTRVDLTASWRINDAVQFFGRLENMTDADYQQVFGYGTPGRSGRVGFRFTF